MNTLLLAVLMIGQPQAPPVKQAMPQAPPVQEERRALTYAEGTARALATGSSIWIYAGIPSKRGDYAPLMCEATSLPGYPAKCIVIARPRDGYLEWEATLDPEGNVLEKKGVKAAPSPFDPSRPRKTAQRE